MPVALRLPGGGRESRSNVLRNSGEWGTSGCTLFTYIGSMYLSWELQSYFFFKCVRIYPSSHSSFALVKLQCFKDILEGDVLK